MTDVQKSKSKIYIIMILLIAGITISSLHVFAANNPYPGSMNTNCTYAAWEYCRRDTGVELPKWGNAINWYSSAKNAGYQTGKTPRAKSIAVWRDVAGLTGAGHVAYIQDYKDGKVHVQEGNYSSANGKVTHDVWVDANKYVQNIKWSDSSGYHEQTFEGFIYITSSTPDPSIGKPMTSGAGQTSRDGDYWIVSEIAQDFFVDIPGDTGNISSGTNVTTCIWGSKMPGPADVFHFRYLNNGFYEITHKASGLAVEVAGGSLNCTANVRLYTANGSNAQQWSITGNGRGYKMYCKCNGFLFDVEGGSYKTNTNVFVWSHNDAKTQ